MAETDLIDALLKFKRPLTQEVLAAESKTTVAEAVLKS